MSYRILDLFCGAGGAAVGYHRAGFDVVGVDIRRQPNYPFEFIQADVVEWFRPERLDGFIAVHASPPCLRYSSVTRLFHDQSSYIDFIPILRQQLEATGLPYLIENVMGSPLIHPAKLCGSTFGLGAFCRDGQWRQLRRHRLWETSFPIWRSECAHVGEPIGVYGKGGGIATTVHGGGTRMGYKGNRKEASEAMGIDWMSTRELSNAVPPSYTHWLGDQLMIQLKAAAA